MKNTLDWRAKKYNDARRSHWGVFVDGHCVDVSLNERDAQLRSCSFCECRDLIVIVRECLPYTTTEGVQRWRVTDIRVTPPSDEDFFGSDWEPAN